MVKSTHSKRLFMSIHLFIWMHKTEYPRIIAYYPSFIPYKPGVPLWDTGKQCRPRSGAIMLGGWSHTRSAKTLISLRRVFAGRTSLIVGLVTRWLISNPYHSGNVQSCGYQVHWDICSKNVDRNNILEARARKSILFVTKFGYIYIYIYIYMCVCVYVLVISLIIDKRLGTQNLVHVGCTVNNRLTGGGSPVGEFSICLFIWSIGIISSKAFITP